jgi:ketosteroid isomerase-like protein
MSRENVELVRRVFDAVDRGDATTILALYDPEVEWDVSGSPFGRLIGGDVYRGHEGLRRWFRQYREAWENVEDHCEELIDAGDYVISLVTDRGRGLSSGVEVEWKQYGVWTIREGKIVRVAWFRERSEALEAAGLREVGDVGGEHRDRAECFQGVEPA